MSCLVPPKVAAEALGWTVDRVYAQLQYGLVPWGNAVKKKGNSNYTYTIYSRKLARWCNIPESTLVAWTEKRKMGFKKNGGKV